MNSSPVKDLKSEDFISSDKLNIKVLYLYSAHIHQTRYSRRLVYTERWLLKLRILRPNYVALYKSLQGATAHTAATARNTGANPFYFSIRALGSFTCVTKHMGQRTKQWFNCLA